MTRPEETATSSEARTGLSEELRQRFQQQDVDALGEVYDRYSRAVWSVAMSVTRADHLAQEAVQDTFLRAWRAADAYDPQRDLGPWLMTIARHASLDLIRREFRPTRGGHEAEQDAVVEDPGIDQVWTAWQVQEALGRLNDEEQLIVRLSFFEDLTQTQIAERLGLPLGTVKSRSHRAHRRLAELLSFLRDDTVPGQETGQTGGRTGGQVTGRPGRRAASSAENRSPPQRRTEQGETRLEGGVAGEYR